MFFFLSHEFLQHYRKRIQPNRQKHDCSFVMHTRLWSYPADYILSMEKHSG